MPDENKITTAPVGAGAKSVADLQAELDALKAQLAAKQGQGVAPSPVMQLEPGQMPTCTCMVKLDESHTVLQTGVTPAEMLFLCAEHNKAAKCNPVSEIVFTGPAVVVTSRGKLNRTPGQERDRLCAKYNPVKVKAVFPGAIPQLPTTFDEAQQIGMGTQLPEAKLVEVGKK